MSLASVNSICTGQRFRWPHGLQVGAGVLRKSKTQKVIGLPEKFYSLGFWSRLKHNELRWSTPNRWPWAAADRQRNSNRNVSLTSQRKTQKLHCTLQERPSGHNKPSCSCRRVVLDSQTGFGSKSHHLAHSNSLRICIYIPQQVYCKSAVYKCVQ
jgi:hypothetical protein